MAETIEALVPEFMNEVWECKKGGAYYLDASQTPPTPVCPLSWNNRELQVAIWNMGMGRQID